MGPLSWIKNLIATFTGEGRKAEMSDVAKCMLKPDLGVDFELDDTWQRMYTRTRAFADEAWFIEGVDDCEPVWYLTSNDLEDAPLAILYATADGLDAQPAQDQHMKVLNYLHQQLSKHGWTVGERVQVENGDQIVYQQGEDLRVVQTKLRGNGTYIIGLYIPDAVRPEGVQVDEAALNKKPAGEDEEQHPSRR